MRAMCVLLAAVWALAGCASIPWRPGPDANYSCANTDVTFYVDFRWEPTPRALLTIAGSDETLELPMLSPNSDLRVDHYIFESADGVRLTVLPRYAFLNRVGQRSLMCDEEIIIVT